VLLLTDLDRNCHPTAVDGELSTGNVVRVSQFGQRGSQPVRVSRRRGTRITPREVAVHRSYPDGVKFALFADNR
jgi:hypothetical protein